MSEEPGLFDEVAYERPSVDDEVVVQLLAGGDVDAVIVSTFSSVDGGPSGVVVRTKFGLVSLPWNRVRPR